MNQSETTPEFDDETETTEPSVLGKRVQGLITQLGGALGLSDDEETDLDGDAFEEDESEDAEADEFADEADEDF